MFENATVWVKEHPYITGGAVIAGILAFVAFRSVSGGGGGGETYVVGASQEDAALAAAQLQAETQLGLASLEFGAQRYVADKQVELGVHELDVSQVLGLAALDVQRETLLAEYSSQATIAQYDRDVELATIGSYRDVSLSQISSNENVSRDYNQTIRDIVTIQNQPAPEPEPTYRDATTEERVAALLNERPDIAGSFYANPDVRAGSWEGWDNTPGTLYRFENPQQFALYWVETGHGSLPQLPQVRTN